MTKNLQNKTAMLNLIAGYKSVYEHENLYYYETNSNINESDILPGGWQCVH